MEVEGAVTTVMLLPNSCSSRAEFVHQPRPSPCSYFPPAERADFFSKKLASFWKRFVQSEKTTLALVQAYDSLGINESSVKDMAFETLTTSLVSPAVLRTATALLDRMERRLAISHSSSVENVDHLLKHANNTAPRRKAPPSHRPSSKRGAAKRSPAPAAAAASSGTPTTATRRYPPRVALSAYMIVAHPGTVLMSGGRGVGEAELMESAAIFVRELELLTRTVLEGPAGRGRFGAQLADFDRAWCAYLYRFVAWKVKDARVLENDLVTAACKLELSMLQACKVTADGKTPDDLTHDMRAIRQQVADDQELLRRKVRQVSGGAGVERMDTAISEARSKFFESKKAETPVTDASGAPPSIDSSSSAGSSIASPAKQATEREKMVNEILHLGVGDGFGGRTDTADQKDLETRLKEIMHNVFWDKLTDSMTRDEPDYTHLISLVKEVRDMLHELEPRQLMKEEIVEKIDLEILSQLLGSGSQDQGAQYLGQILEYSLDTVRKLSAAAKEDEMKESHGKLLSELAASSEVDDNGVSLFVVAVVKGLRFVHEEIRELRDEMSMARFQIAVQPIVSGYAGVEYLQQAFAHRYGPPADAPASLPLTLRWISASKSVAEQEWSEHVGTSPSAGHAPSIVPVLRAGHGALVAQPSPSPAASGNSGQPECNGEKLDKLVRIGLLQLVSGIEGCKVETTPESFQINLPRLRAVQSEFQKVIGISTSMLILRQVLTAEKSKATPAEVENAVAELYKHLVRMLDSSPDAGTGEMVAAMVRASASVGSPSEERIQSRAQVIGRVFVKSFQPDDAVFKMVHRAVHGAFRGVVLGGSGAKGKELADAALRRVGAAKLVDRVVKAAEVVIKVAMVSKNVHGPWYTALMSL